MSVRSVRVGLAVVAASVLVVTGALWAHSVPLPAASSPCVTGLPCPALPAGDWFELVTAPSSEISRSECADPGESEATRWVPTRVEVDVHAVNGAVLSKTSPSDGVWCVPQEDPTQADTGLGWAALMDEAARSVR